MPADVKFKFSGSYQLNPDVAKTIYVRNANGV